MSHDITIKGYKFPDNISSLVITTNLHDMYSLAIKNAYYEIADFGGYINGKKLSFLRKFLTDLRNELESKPELYKALNPKNGWGSYDGLVRNLTILIIAANEFPNGILNDWY